AAVPAGHARRAGLPQRRRFPQALDDGPGLLEAASRQQDDELLAAVARDEVRGPERLAPDRGELAQQAVTGLVAVFVVELLEAVEVEHGDADVGALAPGAGELARELLVPGAAVGQPR